MTRTATRVFGSPFPPHSFTFDQFRDPINNADLVRLDWEVGKLLIISTLPIFAFTCLHNAGGTVTKEILSGFRRKM